MTEPCFFCSKPINPYDAGIYKQVTGFVGGPKKDSMVLREDTGRHACAVCIGKLKAGQAPEQETLFEVPSDSVVDLAKQQSEAELRRLGQI